MSNADTHNCPHCGSKNVYLLSTRDNKDEVECHDCGSETWLVPVSASTNVDTVTTQYHDKIVAEAMNGKIDMNNQIVDLRLHIKRIEKAGKRVQDERNAFAVELSLSKIELRIAKQRIDALEQIRTHDDEPVSASTNHITFWIKDGILNFRTSRGTKGSQSVTRLSGAETSAITEGIYKAYECTSVEWLS
jgi:transcription elongation factor Elf1